MVKILFLAVTLQISHQLSLECDFKDHSTYLGVRYSCVVKNFQTSFNNRTITKIIGNHENGKTNADVHKIFFKFQNCPYIPLNLQEFFPNLEIFYMMKSNLQHVLPGDLKGLRLKSFDVSHNPVEEIPKDFFVDNESIRKISFYDCHLKKIERDALKPLQNLTNVVFDHNECISDREENKNSMKSFIENLYDKCDGNGYYIKEHTPNFCIKNSEKSSENVIKFIGILLIIFLLLIITILSITMLKIYQNYFRSNWHEMKTALTTSS